MEHLGRAERVGMIRGIVGGILMGLANLVPGISGGTMLLAAGVYPQFVGGVAEVSTGRFRVRSLIVLGSVGLGAIVSILLAAGVLKDLVEQHEWVMNSLFIGLTLGGVPLLWRMARPVGPDVLAWAAGGIVAMIALVAARANGWGVGGGSGGGWGLLLVAGIAGGAAMVLPGLSGSYLLAVMGLYLTILGAVESGRDATIDLDWPRVGEALLVVGPFGLGVLIGVIGISNVVKLLLDRFPRATLGLLLGLLVGAVVGLWPFQSTTASDGGLAVPVTFAPTVGQVAASLGLIAVGLVASLAVGRLGNGVKDRAANGR